MSDARTSIYMMHSENFDKLTYFLLASAGTSIGFGITLEPSLRFEWPDSLLIAAICMWAISFWSGVRAIVNKRRMLFANSLMLEQLDANHPAMGGYIRKTADELGFDPIQKRVNVWAKTQMSCLVFGAVSILAWRVASGYPNFTPY